MSNNLDYKQKYLEYKIKYINEKKYIQSGGMLGDDTAIADVLLYPKNKQQLEALIDDSVSTAKFYNTHLKVLSNIPKSIFQKAEQIFIAGVFLNKLTSISTLHIPQLSNNNDGIVMAFCLAVVGDQTIGQSIRQQLNPEFRYPKPEPEPEPERKTAFLEARKRQLKKPTHPSVEEVKQTIAEEESSRHPEAVQDTSMDEEIARAYMDEEIARGYQERDQGRQRSQGFHTMRLGRSQAHAFDPSRLGRVQAHASPSSFEAHASPLHFLATAMQKPTPHTAAATPAPSFRIPQDIRQQLEIIRIPDDEQEFISSYKRFYQKNLGNEERIIGDLLRYCQDRFGKKLNSRILEEFMQWFRENVRPFKQAAALSPQLKVEQMAQILENAERNRGSPDFKYTNPFTNQEITVAPDIFLGELQIHGFEDDIKLKLYNILFEMPESSIDPSIAEGIARDRKVARSLQAQGSQQTRDFHAMGVGEVHALDLDDYAEAERYGDGDDEI
tara:strand:+ start:1943 stop:3436 length:1494 start_codon:yes stop_codon:yes gene_type:complete